MRWLLLVLLILLATPAAEVEPRIGFFYPDGSAFHVFTDAPQYELVTSVQLDCGGPCRINTFREHGLSRVTIRGLEDH